MTDKKGSGGGRRTFNDSASPRTTTGSGLVSHKKSAGPVTTTHGKEGASSQPVTTGEGSGGRPVNVNAAPKKPTR